MKVLKNSFFFEEVEKIINGGESVELLVRGGSMTPYLRDEVDKVVISPLDDSELKTGDIVLFFHSGCHLLHRIIRKREDFFIIQGDGVVKKQEEALLSDIIGVVRNIIRPSGRIVSVNRRSHRLYWRCWLLLRPFRRYLLATNRLFRQQ